MKAVRREQRAMNRASATVARLVMGVVAGILLFFAGAFFVQVFVGPGALTFKVMARAILGDVGGTLGGVCLRVLLRRRRQRRDYT